MPKVNDIAASTAHSQFAEAAGLLGNAKSDAQLLADFNALRESNAKLVEAHESAGDEIEALTQQLAAEKEAHAATQAALDAATATKT